MLLVPETLLRSPFPTKQVLAVDRDHRPPLLQLELLVQLLDPVGRRVAETLLLTFQLFNAKPRTFQVIPELSDGVFFTMQLLLQRLVFATDLVKFPSK